MSQLSKQESQVIERVVTDAVKDQPNMGAAALQFTETSLPPFLRAEVAQVGKDLVFHFYLLDATTPLPGGYEAFWENAFPRCLDESARKHFRSEYPTLQAQRIHEFEINSWWFRAYGFADASLDMPAFIQNFYDRLTSALRS